MANISFVLLEMPKIEARCRITKALIFSHFVQKYAIKYWNSGQPCHEGHQKRNQKYARKKYVYDFVIYFWTTIPIDFK